MVDKIDLIIKANYSFIEKSELKFNIEQNNKSNFYSFFKELLNNAEKLFKVYNAKETQQFNQTILHSFICIQLADCLQNIIKCLPSLRTVERLVHSTYAYHMEGVFQFKSLEEHLSLGMRTLRWNNISNNRMKKESGIMLD